MNHQTAILSAKSLILQMLWDGPATGFELKQAVTAKTEGKMKLLSGSVYPALVTLRELGLVVEYFSGIGSAAKDRFVLTPKGRVQAKEDRETLFLLLGVTRKAFQTRSA